MLDLSILSNLDPKISWKERSNLLGELNEKITRWENKKQLLESIEKLPESIIIKNLIFASSSGCTELLRLLLNVNSDAVKILKPIALNCANKNGHTTCAELLSPPAKTGFFSRWTKTSQGLPSPIEMRCLAK